MELYAFMKHFKKWPDQVLTLMEWESEGTRAAFIRYMIKRYSEKDAELCLNETDKWITKFTDTQI